MPRTMLLHRTRQRPSYEAPQFTKYTRPGHESQAKHTSYKPFRVRLHQLLGYAVGRQLQGVFVDILFASFAAPAPRPTASRHLVRVPFANPSYSTFGQRHNNMKRMHTRGFFGVMSEQRVSTWERLDRGRAFKARGTSAMLSTKAAPSCLDMLSPGLENAKRNGMTASRSEYLLSRTGTSRPAPDGPLRTTNSLKSQGYLKPLHIAKPKIVAAPCQCQT